MILFDTHVHLDDEQFCGQQADVIARAREAGVESLLAVGTTVASSEAVVRLAQEHPEVHAAVGIHPNHVAQAAVGDWERIRELAQEPRVVALGETGLDRYWHDSPLEMQCEFFDRHIHFSQETGLPFIVHMRDSAEDVVRMLRAARARGEVRGVMHSFTGDAALAAECVELGLWISFAGMVTYKKAADLRQVVTGIPAHRILVETDAPYLSPEPKRGQRPNEPAWVVHTAACVAAARGESPDEFARLSTANARELFRV